jgi:hypothetical protein
MASVNDFKKEGVVKGATRKFKGIVLNQFNEQKVEIWNGYKVYTVEACGVKQIFCEYTKKHETEPTKTFMLPVKTFDISVRIPIHQGKHFLKLAKSKINQFPVNSDIASTGHKLQGMTKQYLIVAQLNYSTPNWIYVVLSRVTTLHGLFLLQPIKANFNPQPSKLLQEELHLFSKQSRNFPENVNVHDRP